jgi:bacillithiol system protein YtxJ
MPEIVLRSLADYDQMLQLPRVLLFKHSPACPVSAAAREEYEAFRIRFPAQATAFVDVIADRAVARGLAERCGVRHQSPQAILFVSGKPAWHASHEAITQASLESAWALQD